MVWSTRDVDLRIDHLQSSMDRAAHHGRILGFDCLAAPEGSVTLRTRIPALLCQKLSLCLTVMYLPRLCEPAKPYEVSRPLSGVKTPAPRTLRMAGSSHDQNHRRKNESAWGAYANRRGSRCQCLGNDEFKFYQQRRKQTISSSWNAPEVNLYDKFHAFTPDLRCV
jgi:hypothetical protein